MPIRFLLAAFFLPVLASVLPAEEWPTWRGPRRDGTSLDKDLPIRWSKTENVYWKQPIKGVGHSSPVIWGDRIFLTSCLEKEGRRLLLCLERQTGKTLWEETVLTSKLERKHKLNSYASSTPSTDGKHVWVTFLDDHDVVVACYTVEGKLAWKKSPSKFYSVHGFCSSPILHKELVIINCDQDAEACIVALEKETGKERWRADRPNRTRSYCVPIIVEAAGKEQLVLSGSKCVASYDPNTGKQHWIIDGPTEQYVASLVYGQGLFFLTCGYPTYHLLGIRPDGTGNVTETHVQWRHDEAAGYVPSPVAYDKWFFVVNDGGVASCLDARTGEFQWRKRLGRRHSASPLVANGLIYFPDDDGKVFIVKAAPKFELINTIDMEEELYASFAVSRGQLFIRTLRHLYCIGVPKEKL